MNVSVKRTDKPYTPWKIEYRLNGKRVRVFRRTKADAEEAARQLSARYSSVGSSGFTLTPAEVAEYRRAKALLGNVSLVEVAQAYAEREGVRAGITLGEAMGEFLATKHDLHFGYRSGLKTKIGLLVSTLGRDSSPARFDSDSARRILASLPYAPESVDNYRRVWSTFATWLVVREYLSENPMSRVERPRVRRDTPTFFTKAEIDAFFGAAKRIAPDLLTHFSLSAFFGIRSAEVLRMKDSDINRADRAILIRPEVGKGGLSRLIELPWEACWSRIEAPLTPVYEKTFIEARKAIYEAAGLDWFNSALRKTFISHAVAATQSADRVALISGHRSTDTLHSHYRGLVTRSDGEAFFGLIQERPSHAQQAV